MGIKAHIVMPEDAPPVKIAAVRGYGGAVEFCKPTLQSREEAGRKRQEATGAFFVPPYDHPDMIAGHGTMALEVLELQQSNASAFIVPIGGGGLISGIAIAAKALKPHIRIIGVEPEMANDAYRSKKAGELLKNETPPKTIADGLKTNLGAHTWPVVRDLVDEIITVSEAEIASALRIIMERAKQVVEPSAAVGLAAALSPAFPAAYRGAPTIAPSLGSGKDGIVVIVLSGGNLDLDRLPEILAAGNVNEKRTD
eukprot:GHVT01038611.1.p1 GENE.GHVT01038611.1~~GHVT01038611.1.p1  ORF type:complete len:254 (-),score=36.44 GHVT01038611.1:903-1664(-)